MTTGQIEWVPSKLLNKPYILLTLANFLLLLTYFIMISNVTLITTVLGATKVQAGLASSLFVGGALVSRLWAGPAFDKMGMRKLLYIGLIIYLLTCCIYFLAGTLNTLLIVRFLHGLGYGIATTVVSAAIMMTIPKDRMGEGISWFSNSITIGSAIGPSLGVLALGISGANGVYASCLIMTAITVVVGSQLPNLKPSSKESIEVNEVTKAKEKSFSLSSIFVKTALVPSFLSLLIIFCYINVQSFTLIFTQEIGGVKLGQYYFFIEAVAVVLARTATLKIMDNRNENWILLWTIPCFALGMFMFAFAQNGLWIVLSAFPIGVGLGVSHPVMQMLAVQLSKPEDLGKATGTFYVLMDFGKIVGPIVFGWAATSSYRNGWMFLGGVAIVLYLIYYFMHARKVIAGTVVYLNKKKKEVPLRQAKQTGEVTA